MTNEQLTWAFGLLAGYIALWSFAQWRFNFGVAARIMLLKTAIEQVLGKWDEHNLRNQDNKALLKSIEERLIKMMAHMPRKPK